MIETLEVRLDTHKGARWWLQNLGLFFKVLYNIFHLYFAWTCMYVGACVSKN